MIRIHLSTRNTTSNHIISIEKILFAVIFQLRKNYLIFLEIYVMIGAVTVLNLKVAINYCFRKSVPTDNCNILHATNVIHFVEILRD